MKRDYTDASSRKSQNLNRFNWLSFHSLNFTSVRNVTTHQWYHWLKVLLLAFSWAFDRIWWSRGTVERSGKLRKKLWKKSKPKWALACCLKHLKLRNFLKSVKETQLYKLPSCALLTMHPSHFGLISYILSFILTFFLTRSTSTLGQDHVVNVVIHTVHLTICMQNHI